MYPFNAMTGDKDYYSMTMLHNDVITRVGAVLIKGDARGSAETLLTLTAGYSHFSNIEIGAPYPARREGGTTPWFAFGGFG